MRKTRRNVPKRGGKFKGEGVYGCGFSPPLKCKGEATRRNASKLSKMLISRESAEKEYNESRFIVKLDPERQYFLTADGFCEHDQTNIRQNNEPQKCKKIPLLGPSFLIFYEMGGDNLEKITIPANKYWDFIRSFTMLFTGLSILHDGGMVHLDIKPPNIVSKLTPKGTSYTTRYIDFGVSEQLKGQTQSSDTLWQTASHEFKTYYDYYPIDSISASSHLRIRTSPADISRFLQGWYGYYSRYGNRAIPADMIYMPDMSPKITTQDVLTNFDAKFYSDSKNFLKTVDVYSLCVSLCQVYARITGHTLALNPDGSTEIKFQGGNLTFDELPEIGMSDTSVRFHGELSDFSYAFYDIMKMGLNFSGKYRLTASEIGEAFTRLIANSQNPFSDADITYFALLPIAPVAAPLKQAALLKHQEGKRTLVEFRPENLPKTDMATPEQQPILTLPKGWVTKTSRKGETYYYNPELQHSQYTKPVAGWIEHINESSGKPYWENLQTHKTRWNHPRIPPKTVKNKPISNPKQVEITPPTPFPVEEVKPNPLRNARILRRQKIHERAQMAREAKLVRNPLANLVGETKGVKVTNRTGRFGLDPGFGF